MTLFIRLTKRPGKLPLLICTRPDGSQTIAEITVGPQHDLAHYAVETTLGYSRAFYGLVAGGMNIEEFNVAGAAQKLDLPLEAVHTEFIVGLLQTELLNGQPYADFDLELAKAMSTGRKVVEPLAPLGKERIARIRSTLSSLWEQWRALPSDGSMELEFAIAMQGA
ncbi:MAG: hypothetical protein IPK83_07070 [Planctomycetes bacterium]|nr:hypothetical protein [Planctomycetota bacterium]